MSQTYGIPSPGKHSTKALRGHARYLVLMDVGGVTMARLFLESRELVAEFDASVEEVPAMLNGLQPEMGASGPEWDKALRGDNAAQRAAARVYTLSI